MNKTAFLLVMGGLMSFCVLSAQEEIPGQALPLFQSDEILNLDLKADFKEVFSMKDDSTYFPALLTLTDNFGHRRTIDVEVMTRGNTRRRSDVCSFPPLRLKFPKKETMNTPFEGQKTLKLVTHCNKPDAFEQNIVVEYLIYKAFNVLTDSSFRVRPALIRYIYDDKKSDTIRKFAFFIEREKNLARRLNAIEIESGQVHPDRIHAYQACMVDMFEYMIGNTDYSIYKLHNIILMGDSARRVSLIAIPYDFDWSGLVSATYAEPNPMLGTAEVTERIYRGLKKEPAIVYRTIDLFNAKKQAIYQAFENYEFLNEKEMKKSLEYLDDFYMTINNDRIVNRVFFENARIVPD